MSEMFHPYCFAAWDETDPDWRDTRNADARDAYFSEPCTCGHCPACDDEWQPACPRCGQPLRVEWENGWGFLRCPEHGSHFVKEDTHETPEREAIHAPCAVQSRASEG